MSEMTAAELIRLAASCITCGQVHAERTATDHRGTRFPTPAARDGHMPRLRFTRDALAALRRLHAEASAGHAQPPDAAPVPSPRPEPENPAATPSGPRSTRPARTTSRKTTTRPRRTT